MGVTTRFFWRFVMSDSVLRAETGIELVDTKLFQAHYEVKIGTKCIYIWVQYRYDLPFSMVLGVFGGLADQFGV